METVAITEGVARGPRARRSRMRDTRARSLDQVTRVRERSRRTAFLREDRERGDQGGQDDHEGRRDVGAAGDAVGSLGGGESGRAVGTAFFLHRAERVLGSRLAP